MEERRVPVSLQKTGVRIIFKFCHFRIIKNSMHRQNLELLSYNTFSANREQLLHTLLKKCSSSKGNFVRKVFWESWELMFYCSSSFFGIQGLHTGVFNPKYFLSDFFPFSGMLNIRSRILERFQKNMRNHNFGI